MRFEKFIPTALLQPYIRYFALSENPVQNEYKVLPVPGLVIGFQYKGKLSVIDNQIENKLSSAGITGMTDSYKIFRNSAGIGTVLVYFTEAGFMHFSARPVNELFNISVPLTDIFRRQEVELVEEGLSAAGTDKNRIKIIEQFLLSQLRDIEADKLIIEAVKIIYEEKGATRIKELTQRLYTSASAFEKRFRRVVGTTPKKFASLIRFNTILNNIDHSPSLTDICYENNFFDQAHFIKDFKRYTGSTPEKFRK